METNGGRKQEPHLSQGLLHAGKDDIRSSSILFQGFPGVSDGKESACSVGDPDLIPGLGRSPGEGHHNPLQYSCQGNPHGQRRLVRYNPWGHKELDTTE